MLRRVEEAKKIMEQKMTEEMERRNQILLEEEKKREVGRNQCSFYKFLFIYI